MGYRHCKKNDFSLTFKRPGKKTKQKPTTITFLTAAAASYHRCEHTYHLSSQHKTRKKACVSNFKGVENKNKKKKTKKTKKIKKPKTEILVCWRRSNGYVFANLRFIEERFSSSCHPFPRGRTDRLSQRRPPMKILNTSTAGFNKKRIFHRHSLYL